MTMSLDSSLSCLVSSLSLSSSESSSSATVVGGGVVVVVPIQCLYCRAFSLCSCTVGVTQLIVSQKTSERRL